MASITRGSVLRRIDTLFRQGTASSIPDSSLLERFLVRGDAEAFEALVLRHGPMVLNTCRAVLSDRDDAEDAFQATFIVLVKKAGTIRGKDVLGGWLHRVAVRVSLLANAEVTRRRMHERVAAESRDECL
ncbi:RNA polymerase sigma factor, partial [Singulisphaera rosea]